MTRETLRLPFEVSYSEKPSTKSKNMKRLAVVVKPDAVSGITSSLKEMGLDSTIYDVKRSSREREKTRVSGGRGGSMEVDAEFASRKIIATVVNSDDVREVTDRMKKALKGEKAVVMISAVDDLLMI